ncbi:hypothetical protein ACHAXT_006553 [Thalassiosira profunda]
MAKKRKSSGAAAEGGGLPQPRDDGSGSDDASSSDDDSLVLEGTLVRNPDASDSDDDELSSEEEGEKEQKRLKSDNSAKPTATQQPAKKKKAKSNTPETVNVDFLFCDVHERFFHGIKTLLHRQGVHAPHSSQLADLIIANEMVGTVLSSDLDPSAPAQAKKPAKGAALPAPEEANVFGFASVINATTNHSSPCVQSLKRLCLKHCPSQHKSELETVLSGKTKRPAGFFFQERMVNVPLEITEVLHQQLILDMDHAVNTADDEAERKSLDFGAFVRLAPCYQSEGGNSSVIYKYFDDEAFASHAEFVYDFEAPKLYEGEEEEGRCSVIVMTKTGHRAAMRELKQMIHVG